MNEPDPWATARTQKPQAPVSRPRATKAEVMGDKAATRRLVTELRVRTGQCPRCAAPVLHSTELGILTVIEAIPCSDPEWTYVAAGRATFVVKGQRIHRRTRADIGRDFAGLTAHPEHTQCGRIHPTEFPAAKTDKPSTAWDDVPPFDFIPQICCHCRAWFTEREKDERAFMGYYISPSQWYYRHEWACEDDAAVKRAALRLGARKPRYAKVDKFCRPIPEKGAK